MSSIDCNLEAQIYSQYNKKICIFVLEDIYLKIIQLTKKINFKCTVISFPFC